jgi:hypothetical protein
MATTKPKAKTAKAADPSKTYQSIKDLIVLIDNDADKFFVDENSSAGARIRGNLNIIGKLTKQCRKEIQDLKNARKA